MSIVASELIWRRSAVVNDTGTNGGRMSSTALSSGVKNNIWPDVPQSERTSGSEKYRKVFVHVANDADLSLIAPKVFEETRTPGDDWVIFFQGTQRDVQSDIVGTEAKFGAGVLNTSVSGGTGTIVVAVEDTTVDDRIFRNGVKIRISDKANINAAGNEEYVSVSTATYNSPSAGLVTLVLSTNLVNGYSNTVTKVASVFEPATVACAVTGWSESGAGTYDESTYPVICDSIGTIEQTWTLTMTGATTFTISGDEVGQVWSGNISADANPTNPAFSKPYFTLKGGTPPWGGTWANGNTIVFTTSPAAIPLWYMRVVPAGASSLSGNSVIVAVDGESA